MISLVILNLIIFDKLKDMEDNKEKQQYLFQQIIEKNYDPEEFQEYLSSAKIGGDDLDKWSIDQLKDIVKKFQKSNDKQKGSTPESKNQKEQEHKKSIENRSSIIEEFLQADDLDRGTNKSKKQDLEFDNNSQQFMRQVDCIQLPPNSLVDANNLQANVIRFQKKEGGMFEKSYVSYFINTPFLSKTVERRYSDFEWLKETLEWLHPGLPIPPIAKKGQFRRYDDKHLRKRMMILEMFLNKLLQIPQLRAEQVVENFLKLDDKVGFEKFKAIYVKNKKMIPFKNIKNTTGKLTLGFDPKMNKFLASTQKHFTDTQPTIKLLYKEFKSAATSLQNCGNTLKGISEQCQTLDQVQKNFRKKNEISYCPNNFYTIISQAVSRLADQIINQARIFRTETYSLLKYQSLYMLNVLDNYDTLATFQQKFQDTSSTLAKKKQKLFEEGNVEKWELEQKVDKNNKTQAIRAMLPAQTRKAARIRDIYGLYNYEMYEEVSRYFAKKNLQLGNRLQQCCRNETRLCSEMMMIWVDAETNIMGMRENKSIVKC